MYQEGYVALWRQSIDSRVFKNPDLWKVWTWCLMKATHKERWAEMKTGKSKIEVHLLPGQFIFGRKSAAKELGMPESSVRNRMTKLKNMQNVDIKEDRQYSIISIVNWDTYQVDEKKVDIKEDRQRTGKGQAKDTDNNVKNVKKKRKHAKKRSYTDEFNEVWLVYPNGANKFNAFERWLKMNGDRPENEELISAIKMQSPKWEKDGFKFTPLFSTWLNNKRWEDEVETVKKEEDPWNKL